MIAPIRRSPRARNVPIRVLAAAAIALASVAAPLTGTSPARAQSPNDSGLKTVAVVALSGYDRLMTDIDFVGELAGRPATAQMLEGMIAFFTQGRGVEGMDKSRPIGVVLQTDGAQLVPVGCLPIADINPLLELAEGMGVAPVGAGDGVFEIEMQEQTLFFKQVGEWTFVGQSVEAFASAPQDPAPVLASMVDPYDLGVRVFVQNVPEMYRSIAIEQMRQGMQEGMVRQEGESDEDFELRQRLAEAQIEQLQELITGMDELSLGWAVDSDAKNTFLDITVSGVPGSDMALASEAYDGSPSSVSAFHRPDAAMTMRASGETPPELIEKQREQLESTVQMLRAQAEQGLSEAEDLSDKDREALGEAVGDLLDAYEEMLLSGSVDLAMSVVLEGDTYDAIGAAAVQNPAKIESAFKKLAKIGEGKPEFPGVQWDADSHAGVTMHQMSIPIPAEAGRARDMMGEQIDLTMGVGEKTVYFAAGPDAATSLKQAIDASGSSAGENALPAEMSVAVGQILETAMKVADGQAEQIMRMFVESLAEQPEGNDHIKMTVEPYPNGSRTRLMIEEGVLRAAGAAGAAAAAAQQNAGGF